MILVDDDVLTIKVRRDPLWGGGVSLSASDAASDTSMEL